MTTSRSASQSMRWMPRIWSAIFCWSYEPSSPPIQERTTSVDGSVIASRMRSQRERGASPETIAVAPAAWDAGACGFPFHDVVDVGAAALVPEVFEADCGGRREPVGPLGRARVAGEPAELGELVEPAHPERREQRAAPGDEHARPVDEVPFGHVGDGAALVDVRQVPAQDAFNGRQQRADLVEVAEVAVQVVHAVHPVQRPVRDRVPARRLDLADDAHRQDPVVARRVAERRVGAGEPPVGVGREVHELVDDAVADPGALFAGGAVGERILRVALHGADARPVERVDLGVVGAEERLAGVRVQPLLHLDAVDHRRLVAAADQQVGEAHAVDLDRVEPVVVTAGDVARAGPRDGEARRLVCASAGARGTGCRASCRPPPAA